MLSTSVRFAHMAPWLGPLDLCVLAPGSTTFSGPLVSPGPSADAGLARMDSSDGNSLDAIDGASAIDGALDGEGDDGRHLGVGELERRHASALTAFANHWADTVAAGIV